MKNLKYLGLCIVLFVPALIAAIINPKRAYLLAKQGYKSYKMEKAMRNLACTMMKSGAITVNGKPFTVTC